MIEISILIWWSRAQCN